MLYDVPGADIGALRQQLRDTVDAMRPQTPDDLALIEQNLDAALVAVREAAAYQRPSGPAAEDANYEPPGSGTP